MGALRAQGAWTMHTLSGVDRLSGDRALGLGVTYLPRGPLVD